MFLRLSYRTLYEHIAPWKNEISSTKTFKQQIWQQITLSLKRLTLKNQNYFLNPIFIRVHVFQGPGLQDLVFFEVQVLQDFDFNFKLLYEHFVAWKIRYPLVYKLLNYKKTNHIVDGLYLNQTFYFKSHIDQGPRISRARFFSVHISQGQCFTGIMFLGSMFFRYQVFQCPSPLSRFFRVHVYGSSRASRPSPKIIIFSWAGAHNNETSGLSILILIR